MRVGVCVGEWERIRTELDDFITKPFCFRLTDVWCTKKSVKVGTKYNVSTRGVNFKTDFRLQENFTLYGLIFTFHVTSLDQPDCFVSKEKSTLKYN